MSRDVARITAADFDRLVGADLWGYAPGGGVGADGGEIGEDVAMGDTRTMEIACKKCRRVTTHEVSTTTEEGVSIAECLRCRDLDAEAAKLVEARQREAEIAARAGVSPVKATGARPVASWVALAGGALMMLGAFLPWITFMNPLGGELSRSGVEGDNRDGWILVAFGFIVAITALTMPQQKWARIAWFLLGLAGGAVAGYDIREVIHRISWMDESVRHLASVGTGLYVAAVGAGATVIAGLVWKAR